MNEGGGQANVARGQEPRISTSTRDVTNLVIDRTRSAQIWIMEDRLRLIVIQHGQRISNRFLWVMPASLFATIVLTLTTATFQDALFLTKETWHGFWTFCAVASFIWLLFVLVRYNRKAITVDDFINECIRETP